MERFASYSPSFSVTARDVNVTGGLQLDPMFSQRFGRVCLLSLRDSAQSKFFLH